MATEPPSGPAPRGSRGERELQERYGTAPRARIFYERQVLDHLNEKMRRFLEEQDMLFVATADAEGNADCSFRAGPPGFVRLLNDRTVTFPNYRGNGVMASLGNISENPHVGLFFIDFTRDTIGLHVNGRGRVVENEELVARPDLSEAVRCDLAVTGGQRPERWILVEVEEAYVHCSKHIPRLVRAVGAMDWGTDDPRKKGGDYFGMRADKDG